MWLSSLHDFSLFANVSGDEDRFVFLKKITESYIAALYMLVTVSYRLHSATIEYAPGEICLIQPRNVLMIRCEVRHRASLLACSQSSHSSSSLLSHQQHSYSF
jgi:hypothetical protein